MDANEFKRNEMLAQQIIKGLQSRNMTGYYAESKEKAKEIALSLMPNGCSVSHGGSCSIKEIGLIDELKSGRAIYESEHTENLQYGRRFISGDGHRSFAGSEGGT